MSWQFSISCFPVGFPDHTSSETANHNGLSSAPPHRPPLVSQRSCDTTRACCLLHHPEGNVRNRHARSAELYGRAFAHACDHVRGRGDGGGAGSAGGNECRRSARELTCPSRHMSRP